MTRSILPLALAALLFGCGASATSSSPTTTADSAEADEDWSTAHLRRLDPELREQVRSGTSDRVAIKVFFRADPGDEALSELLLSRVGSQVIGHVELATLHRIAARPDVDRIESLSDIGY